VGATGSAPRRALGSESEAPSHPSHTGFFDARPGPHFSFFQSKVCDVAFDDATMPRKDKEKPPPPPGPAPVYFPLFDHFLVVRLADADGTAGTQITSTQTSACVLKNALPLCFDIRHLACRCSLIAG
jgi:hypothetical protein